MKLKTLALIAASSAMTLPAFAIAANETEFLTLISNTATLNYSINSVVQTEITDDHNFFVDRKLVFSMTRTGDATDTIDGNGSRVHTETYTVQNNSNAPIGIELPATLSSSTISATGGTSSPAQVTTDGFYKLAIGDTETGTTTDSLTITVTTTLTNADITAGSVSYDLAITAVEPEDVLTVTGTDTVPGTSAAAAGSDILITSADTAWNSLLLQTVGITVADDADNSGILRTESKTYTISKPIINLVKTALVTHDPITGNWVEGGNQPKAIPGATVRYILTVTNTGAAAAVGIILTDDLDAFTAVDSKLTITGAEGSSLMRDISGVEIPSSQATLSNANILTFPATTVPAATFKDNGDLDVAGEITATFEVVIKQ